MDREYNCMDRYFRNVSTQRLVFYGISLLSIIVIIILLFTLLPGGNDSSSAGQDKPAGHTALEKVPLVDGHNNLPVKLMQKLLGVISTFPFDSDLSKEETYSWSETDLPRLKSGLVGTQVWTAKAACLSQYKDAVAKTTQQVDAIIRLIDKYKNDLKLVTSSSDINNVFKEKTIGSLLALEGGLSIDNRLAALRLWYRMGVRIMSLTSECDTPWAASYTYKSTTQPLILTDFGEVVVKEMNRLGMIIDLTSSSSDTQMKVLQVSKAPCMFTSSAAYELANNDKNIKQSVFDAIKKNKALVMIRLDSNVLVSASKKPAKIDDVVAQINYWREKLGVDYIGLGSGFNSDDRGAVQSLENSSKFPSLFDRLAKPPFENETVWSIDELEKLAGSNFIRVFEEVEKVRDLNTDGPFENLIPEADIVESYRTCYT